MNLTPTEMDRLTIFAAAEMARRNKAHGVRLSHPEAVAYLTDECMFAARRDMDYEDIRDMAGRLGSTTHICMAPDGSGLVKTLTNSPQDLERLRALNAGSTLHKDEAPNISSAVPLRLLTKRACP